MTLEEAAAKGVTIVPLMKKLCPQIHDQIVCDGKTHDLLSFWGQSVNVDEKNGQTIVHPAILRAIGSLAGRPMRGRVVHAGLQHTYGYRFSLIETPYGPKRQHWVSHEWEQAFGLDPSMLGPQPCEGTLLANLTWFLGQIAFRGNTRLLRKLRRLEHAVAGELARYDFTPITVWRLEEQVILRQKIKRKVQIFTDLITPPHSPANPDAMKAILIYSIQNGASSSPKLITAFPVMENVLQEIKANSTPSKAPVHLRYNVYLAGLSGRTLSGRRHGGLLESSHCP